MKCTIVIDESGDTLLAPTGLSDITVPVTDLDYTGVDTLSYAPAICTPDGRCR